MRIDNKRNGWELDFDGVTIDRDAEVPIGLQLAWALRARIRDGEFRPGKRLPPMRELAEEIGVNLNTVRAVYQRLEHEGLIESQQGSGTFVAPSPPPLSGVGTIAANAAREARRIGVDRREVAAALYVSPESLADRASHAAEETELDQRRLLRAQIAAFERALGEIEAEHPGVAPAGTSPRRSVGPALLSAVELEQVRTDLVRRLATVQAAIDGDLEETALASKRAATAVRGRRKAQGDDVKASTRASRPRATTRPAPAST
jgi:DNA-binding transcriptional regulator YhcF (GntR family)